MCVGNSYCREDGNEEDAALEEATNSCVIPYNKLTSLEKTLISYNEVITQCERNVLKQF